MAGTDCGAAGDETCYTRADSTTSSSMRELVKRCGEDQASCDLGFSALGAAWLCVSSKTKEQRLWKLFPARGRQDVFLALSPSGAITPLESLFQRYRNQVIPQSHSLGLRSCRS